MPELKGDCMPQCLHDLHRSRSPVIPLLNVRCVRTFRTILPSLLALLTAVVAAGAADGQQIANRVVHAVDATQVQPLPNHFPQWANSANDLGAVSPDTEIDRFTIVLARSPQQEAAFEKLLADQQNPASPNYHRWLTPAEVGERFGLSQDDIAAVTGWLQSQGLHVTFVSPSRIFIGFGGKAGDVGRAFQTEFHNYKVNGDELVSVSSEPMIPKALAPVIKAIRGLYTIQDKPLYHAHAVELPSPAWTATPGSQYFVVPADFATIYDLPANLTGTGETIGIVGESEVDPADLTNFADFVHSTIATPTYVVPTAYGGIAPGPPYTAPPGGNISVAAQGEATLDVARASSVAPGAAILMAVSAQTNTNDPIFADAEYLVDTKPVPVQVLSISFGGCESEAGTAGVNLWNTLFQTAASEGISVFVASGDSGASGCDTYNATPPAKPAANSPNYICSSSYATCVGGTEFNDIGNYSTYWSSANSSTLESALSYIPEGAWNEPGNATNGFFASATGGGVSTIIPTPTWQTGTGVPSARTGRYTPDIAFSAAGHDGYFGCWAAGGGNCVVSNGSSSFVSFSGTSAAAPDMAGITVLLDQELGAAQGNLNPRIYGMAATVPAAFHDVTVASSGVTGCAVTTPSMCNNSIPSPTALTGGQTGFLVNAGYDEVTGWGSLDVSQFINNFATGPQAPTVTTGTATSITSTSATLDGTVNPNGAATTVWFLYGASNTLAGAAQTTSQDIGSGPSATPISANLSGLTASTTYYFQAVAQNATGTTNGSIISFTTTAPPTYTIMGAAVTITAPGATTGNTSTITVTPQSGFTAAVALTCSISPVAANDPATCNLSPTSLTNFTGTTPQTSTLTIGTTAATSALNRTRKLFWPTAGGAALACALLVCIPARRRSWRAMLGMIALLFILAGGVAACSSGGGGGGGGGNPGTTAGAYTITVTGTSGSIAETGTVALTVQ
jgi:subtilase family serine protease